MRNWEEYRGYLIAQEDRSPYVFVYDPTSNSKFSVFTARDMLNAHRWVDNQLEAGQFEIVLWSNESDHWVQLDRWTEDGEG